MVSLIYRTELDRKIRKVRKM